MSEIKSLRFLCNVGKIYGFFPISKSKRWNKCYCTFIVLLQCLIGYFLVENFTFWNNNQTSIQTILLILRSLNYCGFTSVCAFVSLNDKSWERLFKNLYFLNSKSCCKSQLLKNLPLVIVSLTFCLGIIVKFYYIFFTNTNKIIYYNIFIDSLGFLIGAIILDVLRLLYDRLNMINKKLKKTLGNMFVIYTHTGQELKEVLEIYKAVSKVSSEVNILFGWPIFMIMPHLFIFFLLIFHRKIQNSEPVTWTQLFLFLLFDGVFVVSIYNYYLN